MTLFYTILSAVIIGMALYVALNSKAKTPNDGILVVLGFITVFILAYYSIQFLAPYFLRTAPGFTQRQFSGVFSGQEYQDITEQIGSTLQGADPIRASINSGGEMAYTVTDVATPTSGAPVAAVEAAPPVITDLVIASPTPVVAQPTAVPPPVPTTNPQAIGLLQQLQAYKDAGNIMGGEWAVDQILAIDPNNAAALSEKQAITAAYGLMQQWDQLGYREGGQRSKFTIADGADIASLLSGFTYLVESSQDVIGLSTEAEAAMIIVTSPGWLLNHPILLARIHLINLGAPDEGDIINLQGGR